MEPVFFESASEFRAWLTERHATEAAIWMGYWKKGSGREGLGYREALEEALCFGWIDGQARSIDAASYMQRWTPRKRASIWSTINIARMEALIAAGRAAPAGMQAFEQRTAGRSGVYSHEQERVQFDASQEAAFRADPAAWVFWEGAPAAYRQSATWWVISAKQEATRGRRLGQLIEACGAGRKLAQSVSPGRRTEGPTG